MIHLEKYISGKIEKLYTSYSYFLPSKINTSLIILFLGVVYFSVQAQQKNASHHSSFSGVWKAKESISIGGNIFCSYDAKDRMVAKTMKIVEQADYLTIENSDSDAASAKSREKLIFNGKTGQINLSKDNRKTFAVKLSNDGQTLTIKSVVYFMTATPYHVNVQKQAYTNVTEVWNLSKDGKSISVMAKAKSNIWDEERNWKTVFDKVN
jgi:hypothetical protein